MEKLCLNRLKVFANNYISGRVSCVPCEKCLCSNEKPVSNYIEHVIQLYEVPTSVLVCRVGMSWSLAICAVTVLHFLVDPAVLASISRFHKNSPVPAFLAVSTLNGALTPLFPTAQYTVHGWKQKYKILITHKFLL